MSATAHPRSLEIGIANFKAFGPRLQPIKLKPLTLVFGPNSGGKSSLIHFLLWLNDVVSNQRLDVYHPAAAGDTVDLGGFKQFRHGNDPATQITTSLTLFIKEAGRDLGQIEAISSFATRPPPADYHARLDQAIKEQFKELVSRNGLPKLLAYLHFAEEKILRRALTGVLVDDYGKHSLESRLDDCFEGRGESMRPLSNLRESVAPKLHQAVTSRLTSLDDLLGTGTPNPKSLPQLDEDELLEELQAVAAAVLDDLAPSPPSVAEAKPALEAFELRDETGIILKATRDGERLLVLDHADFGRIARFRSVSSISEAMKARVTASPGTLVFDDTGSWCPAKLRVRDDRIGAPDELQALISIIEGTEDIPGMLGLCETSARHQTRALRYLAPLRVYPERGMTVADLPADHDAMGLHSWRRLYEDEQLRDKVNGWLGRHSGHQIEVDHQVLWSQVRNRVLREFGVMEATALNDLKEARKLEQDSAFAFPEDWLDSRKGFETAFDNALASVRSETAGKVLLRNRIGKLVSSRDIGLGVSQAVPVLALADDARDSWIIIEQPEIHLHPALQAELGDVFIDSALTRGNRFLLETHSEHLILRVLRRIRETTLGEIEPGQVPVTADDVAVLYVKPGPDGSEIIELPVTPDGDFAVPWPDGFFPERAKELF